MPFFGIFRNKEEKLADAIADLHDKAVLATLRSTIALETVLKEKLGTPLEPNASYDLRCEIFCFYTHMLDYLSFGVLEERGRDIVTDYLNQSQGGMCICRGLGRGLGVPQ